MGTAKRYRAAVSELAAVCAQAGRDPSAVRLVAVSKTVGVDEVVCAMEAGARDFGENRPDQLVEKSSALPQCTWHFIGNIQSRRLPDIVGRAALIHSLHDEGHARKIDALAAARGIVQDVLIEVNVSGEESKGGIAPAAAAGFLDVCSALPHVRARGLMTMAPQGDLARARSVFDDLKTLHEKLRAQMSGENATCFDELSRGMSEDWREAVCAGATIVRIGRAVFSDAFERGRP